MLKYAENLRNMQFPSSGRNPSFFRAKTIPPNCCSPEGLGFHQQLRSLSLAGLQALSGNIRGSRFFSGGEHVDLADIDDL